MNTIFTKKWTARTIVILGLVLWIGCEPAKSQLRLTAAAGIIDKPNLVGQLNVAYDLKNFFVSTDLIRQAVKTGTWFSVKSGYIINVNDQANLRPYVGIGYKPGAKHSYDRYVKDGQVTYLSNGLPTREVTVPVGIQITKGALFLDAGAMAGREITFMITIGLSYSFSKN